MAAAMAARMPCAPVAAGLLSPRASTSASSTAPPGPLPVSPARSRPRVCARRRAAGLARTKPLSPAGLEAAASAVPAGRSGEASWLVAAGAGASGSGATGSGADLGDAASAWPRMLASGAPTGTVSPIRATSSLIVPSSKTSISMAPFCVSTTATMSPRFTVSPGFTSHSASVPASMSAPSEGMRNMPMVQSRPRVRRTAVAIVPACGMAAASRCRA